VCGICDKTHERKGGYCGQCFNAYQRWRKREGKNVTYRPMKAFREAYKVQKVFGFDVDAVSPRKRQPHTIGCQCEECRPFELRRAIQRQKDDKLIQEANSGGQWHPDTITTREEDVAPLVQHPQGCRCWQCEGYDTLEQWLAAATPGLEYEGNSTTD